MYLVISLSRKRDPTNSLSTLKASGYYHYKLTQFLYKNAVVVSVINPLSIKRFIQRKLPKVKTDKSDAKAICEYAQINEVPIYNALTEVQSECLQLFRLYLKQRTTVKNKVLEKKPWEFLQSSCTALKTPKEAVG